MKSIKAYITIYSATYKAIFTNKIEGKSIKMDSYDVHVHPIQFQLYDKESF